MALRTDLANAYVYVCNYLQGTVSILSLATYSVTFTETGLPVGTEWYLNVTAQPSVSSVTTTAFIDLPNETYTYTIATGNKQYDPSPWIGMFSVAGASVPESVTFSLVAYGVRFTETGLPGGTPWWVNLTGGPSFTGNGTTIVFAESNGSYPYIIATADKEYGASGGRVVVNGAAASVSIGFTALPFVVTFAETGLPSGTLWQVSFNGTPLSSTSPWINFTAVAGSYPFVAGGMYWFDSTPASGQISVVGSNQTIQISFAHVLDQVLFGEGNLPEGINWSVTFDGFAGWSTGSGMGFNVVNGTYNYSIPSVDGWSATGIVYSMTDTVGLRTFSSSTYTSQLAVYARWVNATVTFVHISNGTTSTGFLELSEIDWTGIIVLIAVVAIVGSDRVPRVTTPCAGSRVTTSPGGQVDAPA